MRRTIPFWFPSVLLKLLASSFQVGDSTFSWGLFFLYVHQTGQMSTMGLEVSPISPAGLHPCVLVMFALFQQRALVSRRVVWNMDDRFYILLGFHCSILANKD